MVSADVVVMVLLFVVVCDNGGSSRSRSTWLVHVCFHPLAFILGPQIKETYAITSS